MSSHGTRSEVQGRSQEDERGQPDLSKIEPLRSVEELEQAARPGLSPHERAAEDRRAEREAGTDVPDVALPIPSPGGSQISGGPSLGGTPGAFGGANVAVGPLQINKDDEDDEDRTDRAHR